MDKDLSRAHRFASMLLIFFGTCSLEVSASHRDSAIEAHMSEYFLKSEETTVDKSEGNGKETINHVEYDIDLEANIITRRSLIENDHPIVSKSYLDDSGYVSHREVLSAGEVVRRITYQRANGLLSEVRLDNTENEQTVYTSQFEYDDNGKLLLIKKQYETPGEFDIAEYSYDARGFLKGRTHTDRQFPGLEIKTSYRWNSQHQLIRSFQSTKFIDKRFPGPVTRILAHYVYRYDGDGKLIGRDALSFDDSIYSSTNYTYEKHGLTHYRLKHNLLDRRDVYPISYRE